MTDTSTHGDNEQLWFFLFSLLNKSFSILSQVGIQILGYSQNSFGLCIFCETIFTFYHQHFLNYLDIAIGKQQ